MDYDTLPLAKNPDIEDLVGRFDFKLRKLWDKYQEVDFIAHSMGGLITERYLLDAKLTFFHSGLNKIRLVILLGTPHGGSEFAMMASL
jgi:triacylglycerol esterase/lipase EstA (alpha/beta hydrolase family)